MIQGILGKKLGMTQAGPCTVVQKKTESTDGYNALQVGFSARKTHRVNKPMMGHFKKADQGAFACLRELGADNVDDYQVGDQVTCDSVFKAGDIVDVTGTSKVKGFQGVIKRWGFSGGRATHGSKFHRAPGSIGMSATPARVHRGKKMPGQMGNARVTLQNLEIVEVRADQNLILVKGAIPGPNQGLVLIRKCVKAK